METLDKIDRYNLWLRNNKETLIKMTASQRLSAMWDKRRELFGKEAEKIWSGELLATEARKAKMQDTMADLNESKDMTMDEKLEIYQGSLHETYDNTTESFILGQGGLLAEVFFSIDSVQEELKRMSPEQRQEEINRIRKKMGMTDQQIESMARHDADNARRWDEGLKYMERRKALVSQYSGAELEEKLNELREEVFDDEANTIALEEKDRFFRFERPHIYGRN